MIASEAALITSHNSMSYLTACESRSSLVAQLIFALNVSIVWLKLLLLRVYASVCVVKVEGLSDTVGLDGGNSIGAGDAATGSDRISETFGLKCASWNLLQSGL